MTIWTYLYTFSTYHSRIEIRETSSLGFGNDLSVSHIEVTNKNQEAQEALLDKHLTQSPYAVDRALNAYLGFRALGKKVDWLFPDTGSRPS